LDNNLREYFVDKARNEINKSTNSYIKEKEKILKNDSEKKITTELSIKINQDSKIDSVKTWLGVNLKVEDLENKDIVDITIEKNLIYFINEYLPKILKTLNEKIIFCSHCCKYTNSKISAPINLWATNEARNDGYIRSGNCGPVQEDVSVNAALLGYVKFLYLKLEDDKTLLEHFKMDDECAKSNFAHLRLSYSEIKEAILSIKHSENITQTDNKLKQVFFPIGYEDYHLLSILYPSDQLFYLKKNILDNKFSDEAKLVREAKKKNKYSDVEIHDIYDVVEIGFGGTKKQNISYLNSINSTAYMFSSLPPILKKRNVRLPHYDFFRESLYFNNYRGNFKSLHDVFSINYNNQNIRDYRDSVIFNIFDKIIEKVQSIRAVEPGWSEGERYASLPEYQKKILDSKYEDERDLSTDISQFISMIARWIVFSFKKFKFEDHYILGDLEITFINELLNENMEVLS
jgi:CRISPR-associated protein Csy1